MKINYISLVVILLVITGCTNSYLNQDNKKTVSQNYQNKNMEIDYDQIIREYKQALDIYNRILERNPDDLEAHYNKGLIYYNTGDYAQAIQEYKKVLRINPTYKNVYPYEILAEYILKKDIQTSLDYKKGFFYSIKEKPVQALYYYDKVIEKTPNGITYFSRGIAKYLDDDYKGAIEDCNKAIELEPDLAIFYGVRGFFKDLLHSQDAIDDYTKAIQLDPNYITAYHLRGDDLLGKNNNAALADYNKILELYPSDGYIYQQRGLAKNHLGDYKGAVADFDKAISLNVPTIGYVYFNRGLANFGAKNYQEAIKDYDYIITMNPQAYDAYLYRGQAKYSLKDYNGALEEYNLLINKNINNYRAYNLRGLVKYAMKDYNGAIEDYDTAIKLYAQYDYYTNRAEAKYAIGDYEGAIKDWEISIRLPEDKIRVQPLIDKAIEKLKNKH